MNKLGKYVLLLISILFLYSCSQQSNKPTIGFLVDTFKIARWQKDKKYFIERVEELGAKVLVKSADGNDAKQLKLAEELINEGINVLVVVATNSNSAAAIVRLAHSRGVKVIAYARMIKNCDLDYFITFNVEKIGKLQADYIKKIKPQGNYVLINGDKADINAVIEHSGVLKSLKPEIEKGSIGILYDAFIDGWSPIDANYMMKKIIEFSNENIDAVIVGNDGMASGVYKAFADYGLSSKVLLTGLDAEPLALKRIINGKQSMTVYMSIKKLAYTNAELAVKLIKNRKLDYDFKKIYNGRVDVPSIILDPQVVDKSNIEATVITDGFVSQKDIDNAK